MSDAIPRFKINKPTITVVIKNPSRARKNLGRFVDQLDWQVECIAQIMTHITYRTVFYFGKGTDEKIGHHKNDKQYRVKNKRQNDYSNSEHGHSGG